MEDLKASSFLILITLENLYMKTLRVGVSHASIKAHTDHESIEQLRDTRLPIYFRYHTKQRKLGTFYITVNKNSKTHWIKLGVFPQLTPKFAKEKAIKLLKEFAQKQVIPSGLEFKTLEELLLWYHERIIHNKSLSRHTIQNQSIIVNQHLLPCLGQVKINELNLPIINKKLFEPLQRRLALSTIDGILSILNAALMRAKQAELIAYNPIVKCTLAEFTNQRPKVKLTRLTHKALSTRIASINTLKLSHRMLLSMILLHATRIGETVNARWEEFDFEEKLWRIPGEHTKNKKPHTVPLSELAITWLMFYRKHQDKGSKSQYLFAQCNNNRKPMSANQGSSIISTLADKQWSAHDIRKFARSYWMELGIDYMVAEMLLNHTLTKLDQAYIQTLAMPNCRAALELWTMWLVQHGLVPKLTPRHRLD
jgi:integrase